VAAPWDNVVNHTLQYASSEQLLEICDDIDSQHHEGGKEDATSHGKKAAPSTWPTQKDRWCTPKEAILLPARERYGLGMNDGSAYLAQFLITAQCDYVSCYDDLNKTLTDTGTSTQIATPQLVRGLLKQERVSNQMAVGE
jgi:hypothetical protein